MDEVREGKLSVCQSKPVCVHPIGAVKKEGGGICPVTDCKRPIDRSVNSFTREVFTTFSFVKMHQVLSEVSAGVVMCTVDLKAAYCSVLIHPSNRCFFGLQWPIEGKMCYLVDNYICFGAKVAPGCFNRLTDLVTRMMRGYGYCCWNYLDDFICYGSSFDKCREAQHFLIWLLRRWGFYINWAKTTSPKNCM